LHDSTSKDVDEGLIVGPGTRCSWNYLHRAALGLAHHPSAETMEAFVLKNHDCPSCAQFIRRDMHEFGEILTREVKKAVEQVSLSLYPPSHVSMMHAHMRQVPLPKAVSEGPTSSTDSDTIAIWS
jgi:hypothetical protein